MDKLFKTIGYIEKRKVAHFAILWGASLLLSGCLGGTVAQQIARSIATSIADKTIANAMDVNEGKPKVRQSVTLQDRAPSELSMVLMTSRFRSHPTHEQVAMNEPADKPVQISQVSPLVRVQLFNFIIGDERKSIIQNANSTIALNLSYQQNWEHWLVASGIVEDSNEPIIFLIPPEIGKLASGSIAIVELANRGNVNIARYTVADRKVHQAMDQSTHFSWQ